MITITPASPTTGSPVTISVSWGGCIIDSGIQQSGSTFDVHYDYSNTCYATPPAGTEDFAVGTLPAGTYTVVNRTLYEGNFSGQETATFTVAAAAQQVSGIPALDPYGFVILATLVAGAAMHLLLRRSAR